MRKNEKRREKRIGKERRRGTKGEVRERDAVRCSRNS